MSVLFGILKNSLGSFFSFSIIKVAASPRSVTLYFEILD